jgi:hypothetical protein
MNSPAMIYVMSHIQELQAEAAANRLAKMAPRARGERSGRIANALASTRSLLTSAAPISLPTLKNYPYRS